MSAALSFERVTYTYPQSERPALDRVTLEVGCGEFVILAGPSAGGKSTLLKAACGLVPHFHGGEIAGQISAGGADVLAAGPGAMADRVGYLAQEPESQVVSTTVAAEIGLPLELRGAGRSARARAVEEVALALAIPHLLGRTTDTLSGGELQRVALAGALVTRPGLILLDEPTSQLDPVAGDELIWLLRRLNAEWGVTVVLAEHRLERCLAAADRVLSVRDGAVTYDGDPGGFLGWACRNDRALTTPAARLFDGAGIEPLPSGVRQARLRLARRGLAATEPTATAPVTTSGAERPERTGVGVPGRDRPKRFALGRPERALGAEATLKIERLWVELGEREQRRDVLRGVDLRLVPGEKVALMGRNGAGKSTLLGCAADLIEPARGRIEAGGGIALLTQSPADFLVRERVGEELPGPDGAAALATVGLTGREDRDPRDLSGGERQRLALAITLAGRTEPGRVPGLIALDEPTRGLDRDLKDDLAELATELAGQGAAVLIATHDVEFAAAFADRVVLMGDGEVIADGPAAEILSGGWYFATEIARILGLPGVVTPEQGVVALERRLRPDPEPEHQRA